MVFWHTQIQGVHMVASVSTIYPYQSLLANDYKNKSTSYIFITTWRYINEIWAVLRCTCLVSLPIECLVLLRVHKGSYVKQNTDMTLPSTIQFCKERFNTTVRMELWQFCKCHHQFILFRFMTLTKWYYAANYVSNTYIFQLYNQFFFGQIAYWIRPWCQKLEVIYCKALFDLTRQWFQ